MIRTELADLAGWAERRLPRLIEDACAAIVDRVPLYREDHVITSQELHRSVQQNLRFLVTAIGSPQAPRRTNGGQSVAASLAAANPGDRGGRR